MKLVFFSNVLQHHQSNVADLFWELTNHQYRFVEIERPMCSNLKGDTRNYNECPYLLRAWKSKEAYQEAMDLARTADCCVFSGLCALPFQKERMKFGRLSFDMSERWLKKGFINLFSPSIFRMFLAYYGGGWKKKPLYKLCNSAFAAKDHYLLGMYRNSCFKWGYFTQVPELDIDTSLKDRSASTAKILWIARFLQLKHPERMLQLAEYLRYKGYAFEINMIGDGELFEKIKQEIVSRGLSDCVHLMGNMLNPEVIKVIRQHHIFCFTSDRNEGWGAVLNESMSNGCCPVASDMIGSTHFLVNHGENGLIYKSSSVKSLCEQVEYLITHSEERECMARNAYYTMRDVWSPQNATKNFLILVDSLQYNKPIHFTFGPCSKA